MSQAPDILGSDTRPPFFPVANALDLGLAPPPSRGGTPVRAWVRSLAGMQKEAMVVNGATGRVWRLVSDEGPYLAGHDRAPCPLCHFITGMISSYTNEIIAAAARHDIAIHDLRSTLENFYTMEGSALQGTMTGGALNPRLSVELDADASTERIHDVVAEAVRTSPVNGLLSRRLNSRFTLHHNGERVTVGRVEELPTAHPDPGNAFDMVEIAPDPVAGDLMVKARPADQVEGVPGGANTSLLESQSRTLHVRAVCTRGSDGALEIIQDLLSPIGSEFRFLAQAAVASEPPPVAPDPVTYLAAGLGFCFMTQFGRYARITRKQLEEYRIVQDTHFYEGTAGDPGSADPVETHVYLVTPEDEEFSRQTLDMGEQTCFLHATCRGELGIDVKIAFEGRSASG